jgi:hypothetical protein
MRGAVKQLSADRRKRIRGNESKVYLVETCKFWRVVFLVIGGMAFFLKSVIGMSQEKLLISSGNQYLTDDIPFDISMGIW